VITVRLLQVIETRMNSMFELATQDEIDKLRKARIITFFCLQFIPILLYLFVILKTNT
jgi:hypothetical protein